LLEELERLIGSPAAIARLRQFVLDLAVRGKLVAQEAGDVPAVVPLRQARVPSFEGVHLRNLGDVTPALDDLPFEIPATWRWCRLDQVGLVVGGGTPPSGETNNFAPGGAGIPWITPADLGKHVGTLIAHGARDLTPQGFSASSARMMPKGTVLFTSRAPIGYVAIAANAISTNQGFKSLVPSSLVAPEYVATYFRAFAPRFDASAPGTTFKEVSGKLVSAFAFPLPPLEEQKRIAAKIDEMMLFLDQLETVQAEEEQKRGRLRLASLARLIPPAEGAPDQERQEPAQFYLKHCGRMLTKAEHLGDLRRTILHLAVRGLLVGPSTTQSRLANGSGASARNHVDRLAMALPEGWRWVRVRDVATARLGKMLDHAKNRGRDYPYLRNTNVHWFQVRLDSIKTVPLEEAEADEYLLRSGDVLICEGGHGIGRAAVWREKSTEMAFQKALHRVRPSENLVSDFLAYCIFVYFNAGVLERYFTGVGIPHFTGKALASLTLPLPPVAEQQLIVAKVGEMMAACDELELALGAAETGRAKLLQAALEGALVSL
jgi:type I restriction enzyme S subunit